MTLQPFLPQSATEFTLDPFLSCSCTPVTTLRPCGGRTWPLSCSYTPATQTSYAPRQSSGTPSGNRAFCNERRRVSRHRWFKEQRNWEQEQGCRPTIFNACVRMVAARHDIVEGHFVEVDCIRAKIITTHRQQCALGQFLEAHAIKTFDTNAAASSESGTNCGVHSGAVVTP